MSTHSVETRHYVDDPGSIVTMKASLPETKVRSEAAPFTRAANDDNGTSLLQTITQLPVISFAYGTLKDWQKEFTPRDYQPPGDAEKAEHTHTSLSLIEEKTE
ncbi:MAG: hypothetical protein AAGA91_12705 [Pseudomonadota bacterium]